MRGEKIESLQHLIEKEVALGVQELNGENNHKKFKKDTWEYNYISTARTTLRNLWLMDFLEELMKLINEDKKSSLSHIGKQAYNKGLGPHHPWVVRQAAKVGFLAAPSRDTFIKSLGTDET